MVSKILVEQLGNADATNEGDAKATARFALARLTGYRTKAQFKERDIEHLANIFEAYAYLLQKHGVTQTLD